MSFCVRYRALSNQIQIGSNRYKCPKTGRKCWLAPFVPDNDCFEFTPVAAMYEGEELGYNELESIGISRYVQYSILNNEQINIIDKYFE